ncbi:MAG: protoporphyrinogen oxidase [Desulfobulbaceae bacterium]|uniref:Coproporphyrinogen III oxidase n=1 Tax=Candidatus Desulfatifera sulfidica TaxID=2841691 RepID=A0A8J6TDQ1_9BACT|nr:protoporphyrinogen oxidase [Candidatus Desulfatifera sulfidica]
MKRTVDTLIIGAGLSGLSVAHWLKQDCPGHRLLLVDGANHTGGAIASHLEQGYLAEAGPHGFLDNCEESNRLLQETGLDQECVKAPLSRFVRYVCLEDRLRLIPQSPSRIIRAPLISPLAKLRVLGDLFKKPLPGEPTVAQWVEHRFGPALLPFADAVFTGTYAGDIERLVMDGVMPGARELERKHGSLIRGILAKLSKNKKGKNKAKGLPAMTSFPTGMGRLPQRLSEGLKPGEELELNCLVEQIRPNGKSWSVEAEGLTVTASNLVLALPVNAALKLTAGLDMPDDPPPQAGIPEAWIATIACGFDGRSQLPPGFGYLAPEQEGRFALGTLFSSNMFPGRTPEGHILFEILVGGRRHPEKLALDDEEMTRRALADVRTLLNLTGEPSWTKVLRPQGGIPQLEAGYPGLLAWRDRLTTTYPGLYLNGFGWEGIGLNDMMKTAARTAAAIREQRQGAGEEAELKKIYF